MTAQLNEQISFDSYIRSTIRFYLRTSDGDTLICESRRNGDGNITVTTRDLPKLIAQRGHSPRLITVTTGYNDRTFRTHDTLRFHYYDTDGRPRTTGGPTITNLVELPPSGRR